MFNDWSIKDLEAVLTSSEKLDRKLSAAVKAMQRGLGGCPFAWGVPHERHSTQRVQSPEGTLAQRAVQEAIVATRS